MYKCHDIRMRRNTKKTYTFSYISTVPQIQVMCVQCSEELFALTFSPPLRWSKNILHIHTYMYIPLFSMTVRSATFLRKLYFRYFCRDRRDRLGTAVGTAVFYVGTVGTA